jgi:beta-glucosidase
MEQIYEVHKVAQSYSEAYEMSFNSGVDIHMHGPGYYEPMLKAAKEGRIDKKAVDQAVKRILKLKFELGLFENRYVDTTQLDKYILTPAHKEKALEAARKSMVLLKNENQLLPLSKKIKSVLVTGPNAHDHAILGDWVYQQPEENVITVYEGLKDYLPENCNVEYYNCGLIREITDENIKEAVTRAKKHEYAIVVVGTDALRTRWNTKTSGENVGLTSLELQAKQGDLVKALHESGVKVVMVMVNAQPIAPTYAINNVPAIIEAWELGIMGDKAIAQVLFGDYNPSGRLPVSFPRTAGHVQQYYNHKTLFYRSWRICFCRKGAYFSFRIRFIIYNI